MGAVEADALVGTWRLIAACAFAAGTRDSSPLGRSPSGLLIYTRDGTMAALISYDERKPLSVADWIAAPSDEHADAFTTFLAYGGRYALADGRVTHRVEVASVENWVNTDLVRAVKLDGDRLTLRTPQSWSAEGSASWNSSGNVSSAARYHQPARAFSLEPVVANSSASSLTEGRGAG